MIQKRNISTFAIGLCLLALMLLSASPAKAFKTTDPNMNEAYEICLTNDYNGNVRHVIKCFENFRTTYASAYLIGEEVWPSRIQTPLILKNKKVMKEEFIIRKYLNLVC